jgi:hypothetical protein
VLTENASTVSIVALVRTLIYEREAMADTALTEWEGCWVSVAVKGQFLGGYSGRITKVGNDGFIIRPQDSPDQTQGLPPAVFLPWHLVRTVMLEPQ